METILINENRSAVAEFQRSIDDVLSRSQDLMDQFHQFQTWKRINTEDDFIQLVNDPAEYFDQVLINNVDLKSTGNLRPNPEMVAKMFDVERESWQNLVAGKPISDGCETCKKTKIVKGQRSISLAQFQQYQEYLIFQDGRFYADESAIQAKKESFKKFAKSPEEIKLVKHHQDLVTILNEHFNKGLIGPANIQEVAKLLNPVSISFVTNDCRPAMIFEVRRKDGKTVVNAGEKHIPLYDFEFFDTTESFQYFQDHTTPEIIEKADQISGKIERLQFYKKSADDETLNNYRTMVAERMTDDAIRNKFQNYEPGLQSEILFVE
jgi:hypothetical protein